MPDATRSSSIADNNSISLIDNNGAVVDSFSWGEVPEESTGPYGYARAGNSGEFLSVPSLVPRNSQSEIDPFWGEEDPAAPEPEPVGSSDPTVPSDDGTELPPSPTGGRTYTPPLTINYSPAVKISEFMPNPEGSDSGQEWVELFSAQEVDLSGWKLDDEGANGTIGSSAYIFPANTKILANQFMMVAIPKGKFALNNTGGDTLRLLWPNNQTAEEVAYMTAAPEGVSYIRLNTGEFDWTETLVEETATISDEQKEREEATIVYTDEIQINELLPYPSNGAEEFIELKNLSNEEVNLKNWVISDKSSKYKISDLVLPANGYVVLNKSQTKIALNNFGAETVMLQNPLKEVVDQMEYDNPLRNQSYNRIESEDSMWSLAATPGQANLIKTAIVTIANEELNEELFEEYPELVTEPGAVAGSILAEIPAEIIKPEPEIPWKKNVLWPSLSFVWGVIICYSYFRIKFNKMYEQTRID